MALAGEAHDGREVGFDRVVDPCKERVCLAATQDTVEPHGETSHRSEGGRADLERVYFLRLIRGELSAGFDAQRGRNDRGNRVPRFRVPHRLRNLVFQGGPHRLLFSSAPTRQQTLQMRLAPLVTTLLDQTEQGAANSNAVLPALAKVLFKVPRRCRLQSGPPAVRWCLELQPFCDAATREWVSYHAPSRVEALPLGTVLTQCPAGQRMNRRKLLGDRFMSRDPDRQIAEIQIRIAIMNRCSALGRAEIKALA